MNPMNQIRNARKKWKKRISARRDTKVGVVPVGTGGQWQVDRAAAKAERKKATRLDQLARTEIGIRDAALNLLARQERATNSPEIFDLCEICDGSGSVTDWVPGSYPDTRKCETCGESGYVRR